MLNTGIKKHKKGSTPVPEDYKKMFIEHEDYINKVEKNSISGDKKILVEVKKMIPSPFDDSELKKLLDSKVDKSVYEKNKIFVNGQLADVDNTLTSLDEKYDKIGNRIKRINIFLFILTILIIILGVTRII